MKASGLPASLGLKIANTTNPPRNGNGDPRTPQNARQARRLTPGQVRIGYLKLRAALEAEYARLNMPDPAGRAITTLDALLTDRQREALRA
jgi:hypothetical protein